LSELKDKISAAKEAFGEKAIDIIVKDLKIEGWNDKAKKGNCPFHNEVTPSFIWDNKHNVFKCFGCGAKYDILDHYQKKGYSFKESIENLFRETNTDYFMPTTKKKDYRYPKPEASTNMDKVYTYFKSRKISKEVLDYAKVRQDDSGNVVFEFYDETDTLLTVKYKPSHKVQKPQIKNWCQKDADTSPILWGMNQAVFGKPLIITEGEPDRLSAIQAGFVNVVSIPFGANNTSWIEYNWEWLDNFDEIIVCGDNDEAGKKMIDEVVPRLGEWRCKTIIYPLPIKYKDEEKTLKDLNEILYFLGEEALHEVISNSKEVPIADIIDLADVQEIDLENTQGIKSGIKELDQKIGKFYLGTVAVWTGINGSGKSTVINQVCLIESINQNYKTFVFSDELTKTQFKNWIEYPIAGGQYITETPARDDRPAYYKIEPKVKEIIREWYRGKIYLYDNEFDKSAKTILQRMEIMARKHGVKNFLIDNLMMVDLSCYGGEPLERQKMFLLDLMKFARKFNTMVHLVAHPRKLDIVKRLSKMDVSGTGDITNLAHYVMAIHRVTAKEKEGVRNGKGDWITEPINFDVLLECFKNRPVGFQDFVIGLHYDRKSRRCYKTNEDLFKQYKWCQSEQPLKSTAIIEGGDGDEPF
jgi:replicative DNA helicase